MNFEFTSKSFGDDRCEVLDINSKIGVLKQNLFPENCSFLFDGLLLEDEATLVGLGIVEGDVIYVGEKDSFNTPFTINFKTRVAKEISVGLNVLMGEEELGFDVFYNNAPFSSMINPDSSVTHFCCEKLQNIPNRLHCCEKSLQTMASFFSVIDQNIGQALAHPFFKAWKVKRKTKPDFSPIMNNLELESYEHSVEVLHDFNLVWDAFIRTLPPEEEVFGEELCKKVFEMLNLNLNVGNVECDSTCDTRIHSYFLDMFYIGPSRNSTFYNYMAYPPTVQLRGRGINCQTTLGDLLFSYQQYSGKEDLNLASLSYDNSSFDLECRVSEVLLRTSILGKPSAKKHYFYFPFDITKSEDTRRIDDLVEFIEGDGDTQPSESKKKRKKKRKSNQSQSITAHVESSDNGITNNLEKVEDKDAKGIDLAKNDIYGAISKNVRSELEAKHSKLNQLCSEKLDLERTIQEEREHLVVHKQNVEDIIDSKSAEMKNLILMIEKSEDDKNDRLKEVNKIDIELLDLETKMTELKMKKTELFEADTRDDELIYKFDSKKHKLEGYIEKELKIAKEKGNSIEANIQNLEKKLSETKRAIENLPNEVLTFPTVPPVEPNRQLLDFIDNQISEKEKELECPVCFEVACAPIFMCSEMHLICSNCRPKVKECPECRIQYEGKPKRHRYAEKTAEELVRLKTQRAQSERRAF